MSNKKKRPPERPTIEDLYPELSPEEQEEAERNLRAYLELVVRIFERIRRQPGGEEILRQLTEDEEVRTIEDRSNINNRISDEIV
jgi:hypothetical protein